MIQFSITSIAERDPILLYNDKRMGEEKRSKGKPFRRVSLWTPFLADSEGSAHWTPALRGHSLLAVTYHDSQLLNYWLLSASPKKELPFLSYCRRISEA